MRGVRVGLVIGAALLASGFSRAPTPPDPPTADVEYANFLEAALAHAQSELALAQLVQQKSKTRALVEYARRVAAQNSALLDKLDVAAEPEGAGADTSHTPILDTFKPLNGEAFDRAYVAAELEDQQNALEEFQFAADHVLAPDLQQVATDEVAMLQQNITDAQTIVRNLPFSEENKDTSSMVISPRQRN